MATKGSWVSLSKYVEPIALWPFKVRFTKSPFNCDVNGDDGDNDSV